MVTTSPTLWVKPSAGMVAILDRREHRPAEQHQAVGILMVGADGLADEVGDVAADLGHRAACRSAEAVLRRDAQRRSSAAHASRSSVSSSSRRNGPMAQDAVIVLGLAEQQRAAPFEIAQIDVVAQVAPTIAPRPLTASDELRLRVVPGGAARMPISLPVPTAAIGGVLVKISASGPIPTSRYCDQAPCARSGAP